MKIISKFVELKIQMFMSEQNNLTQSAAENTSDMIEIIAPEAMVDIKCSTGYYQRVQQIVAFLAKGKSIEEMRNAHEQIRNQNITEEWVQHYETILIFCREFETKSKELGFTKFVSIEEAKKLLGETED